MQAEWWKEAVGYQIYVKSFFDSDNDGIGDIKGIIHKLDYLENLGVNLLWISPVFQSPMDDNGYDVSDYFKINPVYGSLSDMKELINEIKKRNMKLILDFITNHTSDEHKWFKESRRSKDNKYRDYYIWKGNKNGKKPNNWGSFFTDSCWEYNAKTDDYYMHIFSKKMPDLNWRNKEMREDLIKIAKYWLEMGIDGFRLDAINHIEKDWSFVDSTIMSDGFYKEDWTKFSDLPNVGAYLKDFRSKLTDFEDKVFIGELGGGTSMDLIQDYTSKNSGMLNMVFTFDHCFSNNVHESYKDGWNKETDIVKLKRIFLKYQEKLYQNNWNTISWMNHDHPRVVSHYGNEEYHYESATMLATILLTLHGTPFIYNGEEIGMTNNDFPSLNDYKDVSTIEKNKRLLREGVSLENVKQYAQHVSRDNSRTPFQWSNNQFAGFSEAKPWIKVNDNYQSVNVESQLKTEKSVLKYYQKLISLRIKSRYKDLMIYGECELLYPEHKSVFAFTQRLEKQSITVIANFTKEFCEVPYPDNCILLTSNYKDIKKTDKRLLLRPFEAIILHTGNLDRVAT